MNDQRCACPHCNCTVDANAVQQWGKAYCCEACAMGHRNGERCRMSGCSCGKSDPSEQT